MTSLRARPRASTPDAKPGLLHQLGHGQHHASCRPARYSLSHGTTALHAPPVSLRSSSTSVLSVPPTPPCADAQRRAWNHFFPRPRPLSLQARHTLSSKQDHRSSTFRRDRHGRNQAFGSLQPRLPPAPTRTCSSRQPTSYRLLIALRSTTLQSSAERTSLRIQPPIAPSASQPSPPLQRDRPRARTSRAPTSAPSRCTITCRRDRPRASFVARAWSASRSLDDFA